MSSNSEKFWIGVLENRGCIRYDHVAKIPKLLGGGRVARGREVPAAHGRRTGLVWGLSGILQTNGVVGLIAEVLENVKHSCAISTSAQKFWPSVADIQSRSLSRHSEK